MLTITPRFDSASTKRYFRNDFSADAVLDPSDARCFWRGEGRRLLGLPEVACKATFERLCDNLHPVTGEPLTPRTRADRCIGYDFTFNCPKSVSLMHILAGDARVLDAFRRAVQDTMEELQSDTTCRVRQDGACEDRKTGVLVWSEFIHQLARPENGVPDPQLHAHCFAFNATMDASENRWKAAKFEDIYARVSFYEAWFHTRLAREMVILGYDIAPKGRFWDIAGTPPTLIPKFSHRTQKIEQIALEKSIEDPALKAKIGARSRSPKTDSIAGEALMEVWRSRLAPHERVWLDAPRPESRDPDRFFRELPEITLEQLQALADESEVGKRSAAGRRPKSPTNPPIGSEPEPDRDAEPDGPEGQNEQDRPAEQKERDELGSVETPDVKGVKFTGTTALEKVVRFAANRAFERLAVVPEDALVDNIMRLVPGRFMPEQIVAEMARLKLTTSVLKGRRMVTTPAILAEEKKMIDQAVAGKGKFYPLCLSLPECPKLTTDQRRTVHHVLSSVDSVTIVDGLAGTGKTTAIKAIIGAIEKPLMRDGYVLLAPSARASRQVLREEGFSRADTVAKFLINPELQQHARKGLVWVDEASLLGTRDMLKVQEVCKSLGARLVLSGSSYQHRSMSRGNVLHVLREYAEVSCVYMNQIVRQKGEFKGAVEALSNGHMTDGFDRLNRMGMIKKVDDPCVAAAKEYARHFPGLGEPRNQKKSTIAITPTHNEGAMLTESIRDVLKDQKKLGKSKTFTQLKPVEGSLAERSRTEFYKHGQIIQFHQNTGFRIPGTDTRFGFKAGSQWTVMWQAPFNQVMIRNGLEIAAIPLSKASSFSVYTKEKIELARGDLIRLTANGKTRSGMEELAHRTFGTFEKPTRELNNGSVQRIRRFTRAGDIELDNKLIVPKAFGHFTHGYCHTSQDSQGLSPHRVVLFMTELSGRAACARQFMVSVSRAVDAVSVFTQSIDTLRKAVCQDPKRISGADLAGGRVPKDLVKDGIFRAAADKDNRAYDQGRQRPDRGEDRDYGRAG